MTGCQMDDVIDGYEQSIDNEHIKSVSSYGQVKQQYLYDNSGKIRETLGIVFYHKYSYDNNNRLIKIETSFDESIHSSSMQPPRTELMTSSNSTITWERLYKYDNQGRLSKTESYTKKDGGNFKLTSFQTFEYEGGNVRRENLCDETGSITQFYEYAYDQKGNRIKEKYNVCIIDGTPSNPKLYYERTYKYDDYKNPYQILNIEGPSFYTSANNMIEMTTIWHTDDPRTEISAQTFIYNNLGYPIKMIYEGGEEEYTY